jgi:hypothetical protein
MQILEGRKQSTSDVDITEEAEGHISSDRELDIQETMGKWTTLKTRVYDDQQWQPPLSKIRIPMTHASEITTTPEKPVEQQPLVLTTTENLDIIDELTHHRVVDSQITVSAQPKRLMHNEPLNAVAEHTPDRDICPGIDNASA